MLKKTKKKLEMFICQNFECGFMWLPVYTDGNKRPDIHASGEICPQCNTLQVKED